jgi:hypothetical protein
MSKVEQDILGRPNTSVDSTMRTDQVLFCDAKGNVVSWIEALAVPCGFDCENADKPYHTFED